MNGNTLVKLLGLGKSMRWDGMGWDRVERVVSAFTDATQRDDECLILFSATLCTKCLGIML